MQLSSQRTSLLKQSKIPSIWNEVYSRKCKVPHHGRPTHTAGWRQIHDGDTECLVFTCGDIIQLLNKEQNIMWGTIETLTVGYVWRGSLSSAVIKHNSRPARLFGLCQVWAICIFLASFRISWSHDHATPAACPARYKRSKTATRRLHTPRR